MPRNAAELDVEVEALKTRMAKVEGDLLAEQQSHQRTRADLERWGNRAFLIILALIAAGATSILGMLVTVALYFAGVKK